MLVFCIEQQENRKYSPSTTNRWPQTRQLLFKGGLKRSDKHSQMPLLPFNHSIYQLSPHNISSNYMLFTIKCYPISDCCLYLAFSMSFPWHLSNACVYFFPIWCIMGVIYTLLLQNTWVKVQKSTRKMPTAQHSLHQFIFIPSSKKVKKAHF